MESSTLSDLLEEHRIPYRTGGTHKNVRRGFVGTDCPQCSPNTGTYYLGINEQWGSANCWRCGPVKIGDVLTALGVPREAARRAVQGLLRSRKPPSDRPEGIYDPPKAGTLAKGHVAYLRGRGFDPAEIERLWGVKGIGLSPERGMSWRLFLPVTCNGRAVSWTTRAIGDGVEPRYFASPPEREAMFHKDLLYGWDYVRHAAVVHEGPIDCWRTGPGSVSTFGVSYSPAQVLKLAGLAVRVICFDNEPKARRRAERLADELAGFPGETYIENLKSPDPGCATAREVKRLRSYLV